jgi:hypothetical protein
MAHSFIDNSDFLNHQSFFIDPPYAAIMAPRSRRDKDMSDNKAVKQTIKVFPVVKFCISPGIMINVCGCWYIVGVRKNSYRL